MFEIGDWIVVPGPDAYIALVLIVGSIITTLFGASLFSLRTRSYTIALKQFKKDFPDAKVVFKKKHKGGIKQIVDIETDDGRTFTYRVNSKMRSLGWSDRAHKLVSNQ